eukprot:3842295-Rhodomonas_salina.2
MRQACAVDDEKAGSKHLKVEKNNGSNVLNAPFLPPPARTRMTTGPSLMDGGFPCEGKFS